MKVIIIGAGISGLTAANILIKKGYDVEIFESHSTPGGYTAGFYRKGYYFESGTDAFEMSSIIFPIMKKVGLYKNINFCKLEPYNHVTNNFSFFPTSYKEYKKVIYDHFPLETYNLNKYFKVIDGIYNTMRLFFSSDKYKLMNKIINGPKIGIYYLKYGTLTVPEFIQKYFPKDSNIFRILSCIVPYPNSAAINIGGAFWTIYHDYWTVKTGMQSWADILADNFKTNSGQLHLNSKVQAINVKNQKAIGITLKDAFHKAEIIISAIDFKKTYKMINPEIRQKELMNKIETAKVSPSYFMVYLGLNLPNTELQKYIKSPHSIMYDDDHDVNINNATDICFFKSSRLSIYSPSMINSDFAPANKSSLMITTFSPYNWKERWNKNIDIDAYKKLKEEVKQILLLRVGKIIPELINKIDFVDSATPSTFERFTNNTNGATNAWGLGAENRFYKNSLKTYIHTPITNLYMGSAWATQVGGVPFAIKAGNDCAEEIILKYPIKKR